jgi:hypothetical protein
MGIYRGDSKATPKGQEVARGHPGSPYKGLG